MFRSNDAFQEKVDIGEGSTIDAMIEDVGMLVHDSHLSKELHIDVETYFEELQNDETKAHLVPQSCLPHSRQLHGSEDGSSSSRYGSFGSGYGSSDLEASTQRFSGTIAPFQEPPLTSHLFFGAVNGSSHTWFEIPQAVRDIWWGEFQVLPEQLLGGALQTSEGGVRKFLLRRILGEMSFGPEDAEVSGTTMPNDLQLMAIIAGGTSCDHHEQRLMRRVEDDISRVSAAFDEHMRQLFEHNHLAYIPFPSMMPFVRVVMSVDPSTSSSTVAAVVGPPRCRPEILVLPLPSSLLLFMLPDPPLLYPTSRMVLSHPLDMLYRPPDYMYTLMDVYVF
ncbi:hypothetical protein M9H77_24331 [Catharanthus roseus]|uniref:Uncharacterized protein n=1 Tax=Catharanthus roseus TaxID=4058 RepID=A0ACC0AVI8_CATRO|nr:hypothetical protein M9H77_24331 [Catharanthus roseus]